LSMVYDNDLSYAEYGSMLDGPIIGDFTVRIFGSNVELRCLPNSSSVVNYRVGATVYYSS
jgi:hypothetical protein